MRYAYVDIYLRIASVCCKYTRVRSHFFYCYSLDARIATVCHPSERRRGLPQEGGHQQRNARVQCQIWTSDRLYMGNQSERWLEGMSFMRTPHVALPKTQRLLNCRCVNASFTLNDRTPSAWLSFCFS